MPDPKPNADADSRTNGEFVTRKLTTASGKERTIRMRTLAGGDPDDETPETKPEGKQTTQRPTSETTARPPAANA